jgi:SAM-dependent methyltransferase
VEDYRSESRHRWAAQAAGWEAAADHQSRDTMPVSVAMVEALDLQPGHDVLELAAGPGDVGFLAAELIAPGGTLISSDFVPEMITVAQRRAERLGIDNVRFRQIDAESIDQPAASLDGVLCRWAYMLMADPDAALRETRRVLKPDARVALAAWTLPAENPWASLVGRELLDRGIAEPPAHDAPDQFAWGREGVIAERLDRAGFVEHRVDVVDFVRRFESFEAWIDSLRTLSLRFRTALDGLDEDTRADVLQAIAAKAVPYAGEDGGLVLPARSWVAVASA